MADRPGNFAADDRATEAIRLWERMKGDRGTFEVHWQDCSQYMQPDRADYIIERSPGMKRMQWVFDATPIWAAEQLAAGLHSLLTSPSLRWFALKAEDDRINRIDRVKIWLDAASEGMYSIFNGPKHNFASQSHELYLDQAVIGTSVMAVLESARSGILFSTRHMHECCLAENEEDRIDTIVRQWKYTAKQAFEAWGSAAGPRVLEALDKDDQRQFNFIHLVRPRRKRDDQRRDRMNKPFQSLYVCVEGQNVIAEGGFDEFPYLAPRFAKTTSEIYGRSCAMTALPDVKMLNELMKLVLRAAQKIIDPPLQMPDAGFLMPIKTYPGSLNYYRAGSKDRIEPIQTGGNPQLGTEMIQALRQQIIRAFFVEWLLMPADPTDPAAAGKGVTATYVLQQRDEKMRLLSPMLARMQAEFLGPLIDRVFAILWRKSKALRFGAGSPFLPPPPELSGVPLRVEYVSPIAIAQKSSEMDAITRVIQLATGMFQLDQSVGQYLDSEQIIRIGGDRLYAPPMVIKSPERLAQDRAQQAQAQAEINAHQSMAAMASTIKDAGTGAKNFAQAQAPQQAAA